MLDPMPRKDLETPPPVGFVPADVHQAALDRIARLERLSTKVADFIEDQVKVTRAHAKDSDMGHNNVMLMEIATSHFLDAAREIRAALQGAPQ